MSDHTDAWLQVNVAFPDRATAEQTSLRHLAPALEATRWFLMRKDGAWRCRIHLSGTPAAQAIVRSRVVDLLDEMTNAGYIRGWTPVVYEAETRAFGGTEAMEVAHTLFCADTFHLARFLASATDRPDHRKEVSLLLCRTLMRAAGLDHYEQGDVWQRVAATRPLPAGSSHPEEAFHHQVHRLLSVEPGPEAPHFTSGGAFSGFTPWARAFQMCGRDLASLHIRGCLERGPRSVLAHHLLFHWNRIGLPGPVQAALAHASARVVFEPETVGL